MLSDASRGVAFRDRLAAEMGGVGLGLGLGDGFGDDFGVDLGAGLGVGGVGAVLGLPPPLAAHDSACVCALCGERLVCIYRCMCVYIGVYIYVHICESVCASLTNNKILLLTCPSLPKQIQLAINLPHSPLCLSSHGKLLGMVSLCVYVCVCAYMLMCVCMCMLWLVCSV